MYGIRLYSTLNGENDFHVLERPNEEAFFSHLHKLRLQMQIILAHEKKKKKNGRTSGVTDV